MTEPIDYQGLDQAHATLVDSYCPLWAAMYHRLVKLKVIEKHATEMVCQYIETSLINEHERSYNPLDIDDLFDDDDKDPKKPFPNGE